MQNQTAIYRVSTQHCTLYGVIDPASPEMELEASVAGKLAHTMEKKADYPGVGDYVRIEENGGTRRIVQLLPRKNVLTRKVAGTRRDAQIIAANVDLMLICTSMNQDLNPRRLERYLCVAREAEVSPLIVITKSDLRTDREECACLLRPLGADLLFCSAQTGEGIGMLRQRLSWGVTGALAGSSGVGKSTLINRLMEREILETSQIRLSDGRGRHTTTARQLLCMPGGGAVIDTPGMRELGLVDADHEEAFSDIAALARECRFGNCTHGSEPGCAIQAAVTGGRLDPKRLEAWRKLAKKR